MQRRAEGPRGWRFFSFLLKGEYIGGVGLKQMVGPLRGAEIDGSDKKDKQTVARVRSEIREVRMTILITLFYILLERQRQKASNPFLLPALR